MVIVCCDIDHCFSSAFVSGSLHTIPSYVFTVLKNSYNAYCKCLRVIDHEISVVTLARN